VHHDSLAYRRWRVCGAGVRGCPLDRARTVTPWRTWASETPAQPRRTGRTSCAGVDRAMRREDPALTGLIPPAAQTVPPKRGSLDRMLTWWWPPSAGSPLGRRRLLRLAHIPGLPRRLTPRLRGCADGPVPSVVLALRSSGRSTRGTTSSPRHWPSSVRPHPSRGRRRPHEGDPVAPASPLPVVGTTPSSPPLPSRFRGSEAQAPILSVPRRGREALSGLDQASVRPRTKLTRASEISAGRVV
jgi:hypothetical protein